MDLFTRGKSKGKKRPDSPLIQTIPSQQQHTIGHNSPKSPHVHLADDYSASGIATGRLIDGASSIRSSQSSSIPSTDSDFNNVDVMTETEVEELFERMLVRRGIHDKDAIMKMSSFSIDKKRLMVAQDIQAEATNAEITSSKRGALDKKTDQTEAKGPEYYVKALSDMSKGINGKCVSRLSVGLRTMPLSWVRQFIDMKGLQVITDLLKVINKTKNKQENDLSIEADVLKCFKALLNNRVGAREALKHPQCVQQIVRCIVSPSINSRRLVCEVLVFVCYYDVPVGQDLVLKAMDHLRDRQKGLGRFDAWLNELELTLGGRGRMGSLVGASDDFKRMAAYGPPDNQLTEFALYNMILVNAIVNVVEDPEIRVHLRNQMTASGLERIMDKMTGLCDEHIDRQVREFKVLAENDQDDIMDMYQEHILNDLNDPRDVFESILSSLEGTRGYDFFLSCLQHLLLVNNEDPGLRSRYFQIVDNLVAQVLLDHKGLADDFSADYTTTVQHLVSKFADQDQLKATLEDIRELQKNNEELERERDTLREQLSEQGDALEIVQLKEKTVSLEDLLRISRHTITTLQRKLRDLQTDYEASLERAENQLEEFNKLIDEDKSNTEGDIVISRKQLSTVIGRINTHNALEGRKKDTAFPLPSEVSSSIELERSKHKPMAMGLSEEFKSQLARQFGSTSILGDFILPGSMSLMGSAVRRSNNRRRHAKIETLPQISIEPLNVEDIIPEGDNFSEIHQYHSSRRSSKSSITSTHIKDIRKDSQAQSETVKPNDDIDDNTALSTISTSVNEEDTNTKIGYQQQDRKSNIPITPDTAHRPLAPASQTPPSPVLLPNQEDSVEKPVRQSLSQNTPIPSPPTAVASPLVPSPPPPPPPSSSPNTILPNTSNENIPSIPSPPPPPPSLSVPKVVPVNTSPPHAPPAPPFPSAPALPVGVVTGPRKHINHLPSVKTRQLQWQKLNANHIGFTFWKADTSEDRDKELEEMLNAEGIFDRMEETFAQKTITTQKSTKKEKREEIRIIDSRKAYNISISVLAKCKNIAFTEFKKKILAVDEKFCTEVLLQNLQANAPSHDEMGKLSVFLRTASETDLEALSKPDAFCAEIMSIDRFKERVSNMLFVSSFNERITQLGRNMTNIMDASTSLKESQAFKDFLNVVLMVGNFLNGMNFQGGAFGIRISSINKLVDTRASSNDTTLLHFLCTVIGEKFPIINEHLVPDLELSKEACRVTIQDLIKDYNDLRVGLQTLIHELDCHYGQEYEAEIGDNFASRMYAFRDRAIEKFDQLEVRYTSMDVAYKDVVSYFGEDPSNMKPDEFFGIFQTFVSSWKRANSDIELQKKKKEQTEKAKQNQEQRKLRHKKRLEISNGTSEGQEDKYIMDNLLEKLRSGEMATTSHRKSRRMSTRERRTTRTESMVVKVEDLLKHIQNEEETPPLPRPKSGSRRFTSSEKMKKLAFLADKGEATVNQT